MRLSIPVVLAALTFCSAPCQAAEPINVVVWDEQQPRQKEAYDNFLGNEIAKYLSSQPGLNVRSTNLSASGKGIADNVLDSCQVLVWWGHVRQAEITPAEGKQIVARIKRGQLSLIALHSAHWSTPFIEAMNARAKDDALGQVVRVGPHQEVLTRLPEVVDALQGDASGEVGVLGDR